MQYFSLNLELGDFFVFFEIFENLLDYLLRFTWFIDMFDTLLIITLFLLASLLACLLTLRLSINIKHLSLFSFVTDINGYLEIPTPSSTPPRLLNLTMISDPPFYFDSPFIRHLRLSFWLTLRQFQGLLHLEYPNTLGSTQIFFLKFHMISFLQSNTWRHWGLQLSNKC